MTIRNQRFSLLKQPIYSTLNQHLIDYPTPSNLSYWWGSLAGICLVIQIVVTGVFLAMHLDLAFNSVEHIMRDVEGGWLLRYMHANGASMLLIVRLLLVKRKGVFLRRAFIGYIPPWGQMSFWGATVITSLASAIPVVGDTIVAWFWKDDLISLNVIPGTNPGMDAVALPAPLNIVIQAPPLHPVEPPHEGCGSGPRTKWAIVTGLAVAAVFYFNTGQHAQESKELVASFFKTIVELV